MRLLITLLLVLAPLCQAALTREQKRADFLQMFAIFDKQYGPYEWKLTLFGFDLFEVQPWLDRVDASKDDLEFYDICQEYVAKLNDGHANFSIPSSYNVTLGLSVDIYEGAILITSVSRSLLPMSRYPFVAGDELVSVDGVPALELAERFRRHAGWGGNPRGQLRSAAQMTVSRSQSRFARLPELGPAAKVEIRRASSGAVEAYELTWYKSGLPLLEIGPVPAPRMAALAAGAAGRPSGIPIPPDTPEWMRPALEIGWAGVLPGEQTGVSGLGQRTPLFAPPVGFVTRLGRFTLDEYYTGAFEAGGKRIGLIRIPTMAPVNSLRDAYSLFETEVQWMQQNTDGLIVDVMRNTGGYIIYGHELARRLIPTPFQGVGFELRATWSRLMSVYSDWQYARLTGASSETLQMWENTFNELQTAYLANRGRTKPLPLGMPSLDLQPAASPEGGTIAYTKPLVVLIDDFSFSTADLFPALIQDAGRGPLVGMRTGGGGGTNTSYLAATYAEASTGMTMGLMVRPKTLTFEGFPETRYIENTGVRPDIELDLMTRENLANGGQTFRDKLIELILAEIAKQPAPAPAPAGQGASH